MQDRPEVTELAGVDGRLARAGVDLFAGDFFDVLPERPFDVVMWVNVAHTYDGARNVEIYRRVRLLLAPGGGIAILALLRWMGHALGRLRHADALLHRRRRCPHGVRDRRIEHHEGVAKLRRGVQWT